MAILHFSWQGSQSVYLIVPPAMPNRVQQLITQKNQNTFNNVISFQKKQQHYNQQ
jgi:hypothetical protein